jgi:hypothetical protein
MVFAPMAMIAEILVAIGLSACAFKAQAQGTFQLNAALKLCR